MMDLQRFWSGMGGACHIRCGHHSADVYRWGPPLGAVNFRVVLWLNNGLDGSQVVDGFKSFAAAQAFAEHMLTEVAR